MLYNDFELLINSMGNPPTIWIQIIDSPAGNSDPIPYVLPASTGEVKRFIEDVGNSVVSLSQGRHADSSFVKQFGSQLFRSFPVKVQAAYRSSLNLSTRDGRGLRLVLRTNKSALSRIPWECLYDVEGEEFIGLNKSTPIIRFRNVFRPIETSSPIVALPINILLVAPNPSDNPVPRLREEIQYLSSALSELVTKGVVKLHQVHTPVSWESFTQVFDYVDVNILHFIGHSEFDEKREEATLVFESATEKQKSDERSAEELGQLVASKHQSNVLLAIINSCQSGTTDTTGKVPSIADRLVAAGIPSVIAMQFKVTGNASAAFSKSFYTKLLAIGENGEVPTLEEATTASRSSIRNYLPSGTPEWVTPLIVTKRSISFPRFIANKVGPGIETGESNGPRHDGNWPEIGLVELSDDTSVSFDHIADKIRETKCVFIVGTEFAEAVGLPGTQDIANHLLEKLRRKPYMTAFPDAAELFENKFDRVELVNAITTYLQPYTEASSQTGRIDKIRDLPLKTFITTNNLNMILEEVLGGNVGVFWRGDQMRRISDPHKSVIKVYGDLDKSDNKDMVLTSSDHMNFRDRKKDFGSWLRTIEMQNCLVFVGFDPEGDELRMFDQKIRADKLSYSNKSYLIAANKRPPKNLYIQWGKLDVELIHSSIPSFLNTIYQKLS